MNYFFLLFLAIYSLFHLYFYLLATSLITNTILRIILGIILLLLLFSFFIARLIETKYFTLSVLITYISSFWMGLLILFSTFSITLFILGIFYKPFGIVINNFGYASLISILLVVYGYTNAQKIHIKTITIESDKIKNPLKIIFFSDLHAGLIINKDYIKNTVHLINTQKPDLVLAGGDIIDSSMDGLKDSLYEFRSINPKYGKYAILGNHESYRGQDQCQQQLENVGFIVLRDKCKKVNDFLSIAGVSDNYLKNMTDEKILRECLKNNFTIFLKHRPIVQNTAIELFDLQLSGHTHSGQMFPFNIVTKLYYKGKDYGMFQLKKGSLLISSGCGTWGPPLRIFSNSEIVAIYLNPTNN